MNNQKAHAGVPRGHVRVWARPRDETQTSDATQTRSAVHDWTSASVQRAHAQTSMCTYIHVYIHIQLCECTALAVVSARYQTRTDDVPRTCITCK